MSLDEEVSLLREVKLVSCGKDVKSTDLTGLHCLIVLLKHKVLEVGKELGFTTLLSEDPIKEVTVTEGITWEGEGTTIFDPLATGFAEITGDTKDVAVLAIFTEVIIAEGDNRLNVLNINDDLT